MKAVCLKFYLTLVAGLLFSQLSLAKEVVVLVPGFFNAFAPEYFSQDIIRTFQAKGFEVYVTTSLNPTGFIAPNGAALEKVLADIEAKEGSRVTFHLVAHSAGGFYAMWVANQQKYNIKTIFTISTPYRGVEFVQSWLENSFIFRELAALARLDAIHELTATGIQKFISTIRLSPETRIYAFGGYQYQGLDITDSRNLSLPLRVTQFYTSEKSDGIVGFSSALALGNLMTTKGKRAQQFFDAKFNVNLEHWEQVLDSRTFVLFGVRNTDYIRQEQIRFYTGLADLLRQVR